MILSRKAGYDRDTAEQTPDARGRAQQQTNPTIGYLSGRSPDVETQDGAMAFCQTAVHFEVKCGRRIKSVCSRFFSLRLIWAMWIMQPFGSLSVQTTGTTSV
jgi:hypothetical protein